MKESVPIKGSATFAPLIELQGKDGFSSVGVVVHHTHLDSLIGRLMQMCDLIGDVEQRTALKSTIKQITREWLDNQYESAGYDKFTGVREGMQTFEVPEQVVNKN